VLCLFTLKGFQPQQIQSKLSDDYQEHAFQLPVVEKRRLCFADRARGPEDGPKSGRQKESDLADLIADLPLEKPFTSCEAICRQPKIPKTVCF
jgi:hypothetical protein